MSSETIAQFEGLIRRDPARRGLISSEAQFGPLCPGHLLGAATDLAQSGRAVAIVTGFYIPKAQPPAAETDGPPGALMLAQALTLAGIKVWILTDTLCGPALRATALATGFSTDQVLECPLAGERWCEDFLTSGPGRELSHLIAIERVGPSHSISSLRAQRRMGPVPEEEFRALVAEETCGHCHNMRGENIDDRTAPLHLLFERARERFPCLKQIGIGDGGNEIGMGIIPWEELRRRLHGDHSARITCRVSTDWNIIAGISNWGGYALAAATLLLKSQVDLLQPYSISQQEAVLRYLIQHGPAVDGVTRQQEASVDGLPFLTYIQPWAGIRRLLGWPD